MAHHRRHRHRYHSFSEGYSDLQQRGSGGAGSKNEGAFMIIFGFVFFAVGIFVVWLMNSDVEGVVKENAGIGTGAGIFFALIGLLIIGSGIRSILNYRKILNEGRRYYGKIWQHEPDTSYYVNNQPGVALVVHYMGDDGQPKEEIVKTGSTKAEKFPLGATVEIAITEGGAIMVPKSVSNDPIPYQEELLKPVAFGAPQGFGPTAVGTGEIAVACPGCQSAVMVVPGSTVVCSVCGRQFTLTTDRMIV